MYCFDRTWLIVSVGENVDFAMCLNIFHKDNPKSKKQRREEFLSFIEEEPYKSAIAAFDAAQGAAAALFPRRRRRGRADEKSPHHGVYHR
jgi:hypothetical protein